jgi:hypothetical protein
MVGYCVAASFVAMVFAMIIWHVGFEVTFMVVASVALASWLVFMAGRKWHFH